MTNSISPEKEIEWERLRDFLRLAQKAQKRYIPSESEKDSVNDDKMNVSRKTIDLFFKFMTSKTGLFLKKPLVNELSEIIDNLGLIRSVQFDMCVLASSPKEFGYKNEIHLWITSSDYTNATLMIYLAYIILGHPDWNDGHIKLFAIFPVNEIEEQRIKLALQ